MDNRTSLEARLAAELDRYGIDHPEHPGVKSFESLLRHIYNNRDATYGAKDLTIEFLQEKIDRLENNGRF